MDVRKLHSWNNRHFLIEFDWIFSWNLWDVFTRAALLTWGRSLCTRCTGAASCGCYKSQSLVFPPRRSLRPWPACDTDRWPPGLWCTLQTDRQEKSFVLRAHVCWNTAEVVSRDGVFVLSLSLSRFSKCPLVSLVLVFMVYGQLRKCLSTVIWDTF